MTARIKRIREPPLLSPPRYAEPAWLKVTDEDRAAMLSALDKIRTSSDEYAVEDLAMHHHMLKGLGIVADLTDEDVRKMSGRRQIAYLLGPARGWFIGRLTFHMKELGIGSPASDDEKKYMLEELVRVRDGPGRRSVGPMHCYLRSAGVDAEVTDEDLEFIRGGIEGERQLRDGSGLAWAYYHIKKAGIMLAPTEGDLEHMREGLERYRRNKDGQMLARMHFFLRALLPSTKGTEAESKMPPLRRFGGGG